MIQQAKRICQIRFSIQPESFHPEYLTDHSVLKKGGDHILKKLLTIVAAAIMVLSALACCTMKGILQSENRDTFGNLQYSIELTIPDRNLSDDEILEILQSIQEMWDVEIFKTVYGFDGEGGIIRAGLFKDGEIPEEARKNQQLLWGSWQLDNSWIANEPLKDEQKQSGQLRNPFHTAPIWITDLQTLFQSEKYSSSGTYSISSDSADLFSRKSEIAEYLAAQLNVPVTEVLNKSFEAETSHSSLMVVFSVLAALLLLICFSLCLYAPAADAGILCVMRLQGYSSFNQFQQLFLQPLLRGIMIGGIGGWILLSILYPQINLADLKECLLLWTVESGVMILLLMLSLILWNKGSLNQQLKKKRSGKLTLVTVGILKAIVVVSLAFMLPGLGKGLSNALTLWNSWSFCKQYSQTDTLVSIDTAQGQFQSILEGSSDLPERLLNLFTELEKTAEAGFIDLSRGSVAIDQTQWVPVSWMITNRCLLETMNPDLIPTLNEVQENLGSSSKIEVLVPEDLMHDAWPDIQSWIVQNLQVQAVEIQPAGYDGSSVPVYADTLDLVMQGNRKCDNAIVIVLEGNQFAPLAGFFMQSARNNPVRIFNASQKQLQIQEALEHNGLEDQISFGSLLEYVWKPELESGLQMTGIWLFASLLFLGISLFAGWVLSAVYLIAERKAVMVKRLMGYSVFDRFGCFWYYPFLLWFTMFCMLWQTRMQEGKLAAFLFGLILAFSDIVLNLLFAKKLDRKKLGEMLKKEEL